MNDPEPGPPQASIDPADVLVGESATSIDVRLVQEVFREVTGKNPSLEEKFTKNYLIKFEDVEELHFKVMQTLQQYHIIARSMNFTTYYCNDTKEVNDVFETVVFLRTASASQVESVVLTYKFMIKPSDARQVQNYVVTVRLTSPIALEKRFRTDPFGAPPSRLIRMMSNRSTSSKIEYADYNVARMFQTVIHDWFSTLKQTDQTAFWNLHRLTATGYQGFFHFL